MTPRALLSCFFAAYGVYLTFNGIFAAVAALGGLWMALHLGYGDGTWLVIIQYAVSILPVVIGVALVLLARRLGAISAKFAGLADDIIWNVQLSARELLTVLLTAIGVYLVVIEGGAIVRLLFLMFEIKAGNHAIAETAARNLPDGSQLIAHGVCVVAGLFLAQKSRQIASRLVENTKDVR